MGDKRYEYDIHSENLDKQAVFAAINEIMKRALPNGEAHQEKIHKQENPYNDTPCDVHLKNLRKDFRKS